MKALIFHGLVAAIQATGFIIFKFYSLDIL